MTMLRWTIVIVYFVGFVLTFVLNISIGPVTPTLALARAIAWPVWITTGWPHGVRYGERCDDDECG